MGDDASESGQVVDEVSADFAVVENSGTVFGEFSESLGEDRSDVRLAFLQKLVGLRVNEGRSRMNHWLEWSVQPPLNMAILSSIPDHVNLFFSYYLKTPNSRNPKWIS